MYLKDKQINKIFYQLTIFKLFLLNQLFISLQITEKDIIRACKLIEQSNKICILVGAGISTNCGIPDFRSKNGLYNQKNNLNLIFPEQVFDIEYFYKRPMPFYQISNIFITKDQSTHSNFTPSFAHFFLKQLDILKTNLLLITQNIDDLEKAVDIKKLSQAHGSFTSQLYCKHCKLTFENKAFQHGVINNQPVCCQQCGKILKPNIVFYGEDLNEDPMNYFKFLDSADLLIVSGTSLAVEPVASLSQYMKVLKKPRLLINNSLVGGIKTNNIDVALLGDIDQTCQKLAKQLNIYDNITDNIQQFKKENVKTNNEITNEKIQTKYAILMNSLISPDMYFIKIKNNLYSIVQITQEQEQVLQQFEQQCDCKDMVIKQFEKYFDDIDINNIKCYDKCTKHNGFIVFSPINGSIQFYCQKIIQSQNQNFLDEITSQQNTHKKENYIYQDCQCLEGYISYVQLIKYLINNLVNGKLTLKQDHEVNVEEFQYMDQCDYVYQLNDEQINKMIQDGIGFLNYHIKNL